jgi:hypothetical protein
MNSDEDDNDDDDNEILKGAIADEFNSSRMSAYGKEFNEISSLVFTFCGLTMLFPSTMAAEWE